MSFASMPLYTGDYLRDTRHLTPEEHGVYLLFLAYCWDHAGPVPLDERKQSGICNARGGGEIESMRRVLREFFVLMDDGWYNRRIMLEIEKFNAISNKRSGAAHKRWSARNKIKEIDNAFALQEQCLRTSPSPSPSPTPTPIQNP